MTGFLSGKKILLISPQPWSDIWISKHHYAVELSRMGNTVYFLNPPTADIKHGSCRVANEPVPGVFIIDYRPLFPMRWKFRFNGLFNFFIHRQVKKIVAMMGGALDIVWDFEPNRQFADLRWFNAGVKVYHPVDATPLMNGATKNADFIFSVSEVILDYFRTSKVPHYFINHGLGSAFSEASKKRLEDGNLTHSRSDSQLNFGYVGNLLMRYINHNLFMEVISGNPEMRFHIWGPYDYSRINFPEPDASKVIRFIKFLKNSSNVILYGQQPHKVILPAVDGLDGFFWCYDNERDPNKGSNSHKLLEYLSTGKVVVSTFVSTYEKYANDGLMVMAASDEEYKRKFEMVKSSIEDFNSTPLMTLRFQFALNNTYSSHLTNIESCLIQLT